MTALYCRVGDLAIVVRAEQPQNLGQIVEVLGLQTGNPFTMSSHGHVWQVRTASGRSTLHYRLRVEGINVQHSEGPVPDRCLRPVSGLADDAAVHTDTGKKLASPRRKTKPVVKATEETPA